VMPQAQAAQALRAVQAQAAADPTEARHGDERE
jgi:hypothetical protein